MPLTVEQLKQRVHIELQSMPPGVSRIAVDGLYSLLARQRDTYPKDGYSATYEIMMLCSSYWLNSSADPISETVRLNTSEKGQDWVRRVEGQLFETTVMLAREAMPEVEYDEPRIAPPEPPRQQGSTVLPRTCHVTTQTEWTIPLMPKARTIYHHDYHGANDSKAQREILQEFEKIPAKYRTLESEGCTVTVGFNPRDLTRLCVPTAPLQHLACQLSSLFRLLLPHHKYSTITIRDSAGKGLHRDIRN